MSLRTLRIGEQLRGELARLLRDEVGDPRIGLVTLTRVEVAPDLSTASVFFSPLEPGARDADANLASNDIALLERGLNSASGFLRKRLARELSLRRMPELRFRHDPSLARGSETLSLLRELAEERGERARREEQAAALSESPRPPGERE